MPNPADFIPTTPPSDERRAAATWVAGTGAFLLLAAAALFVAVHWGRIPPGGKLAIVVALTGTCITSATVVRRSLPVTSAALCHLGAFLVPVDVAAVGVHAGWGWPTMLLAQGLAGAVTFAALSRISASVVMRWAAEAATIAAAAGIGATTSLPSSIVLALAAGAASVGRRASAARRLAMIAGAAPLISSAVVGLLNGRGSGVALTLSTSGPRLVWIGPIAGLVSAAVLGIEARRSGRTSGAVVALVVALVGLGSGWQSAALPSTTTLVALGVLLAAIEVAALSLADDPFWAQPVSAIASVGEVLASVVALVALGVVLASALLGHALVHTGDFVVGFAAFGAAWAIAEQRRADPFLRAALALASSFSISAAAAFTGSVPVAAAVTMGLAFRLGVSRRPLTSMTSGAFVVIALTGARLHPAIGLAVGGTGALLLMAQAARRATTATDAVALSAVNVAVVVGAAYIGRPLLRPLGGTLAAIVMIWASTTLLEAMGRRHAATASRLGLGVALATGLGALSPAGGVATSVLVVALVAFDAVGLDRPELGFGAAATVQVAIIELGRMAGLAWADIGLACAVAAIVWAGLALVVDVRWQPPFVAAAIVGAGLGTALAARDPRALADCLVVIGALVATGAFLHDNDHLAFSGGFLTLAGVGGHLQAVGVRTPEAYALPAAAYLLACGLVVRRRQPVSSWLAHTPAVLLLGGVALAARVDGGPAWHALVAGSVGVAAVALGGWRRLVGPLFTGTALLIAVAVHESLGTLAQVQTWAWLAVGGSTLLVVGIALERIEPSVGDLKRRVVDVVAERFS